MDFFIDISSWQSTYTIEAYRLLKLWNMRAMVIRGGYSVYEDKMAVQHIELARKLELPFGLYWFLYPEVDFRPQIDAFVKFVDKYPDSTVISPDFEQYRNSYSGVPYSKDYLERFYEQSYNALVKALPEKNIKIYTAKWCVDGYFPGIADLLMGLDEWYASYVKYNGSWWVGYIASLGGHWADNSKPISIIHLPAIMDEIWKHKDSVGLPKGVTDWSAWQCITFIPFTELSWGQRHMDYNLATPKVMYEWFGVGEVSIIKPPPPNFPPFIGKVYRSTAPLGLLIRTGAGPDYEVVGYLGLGSVITALDELNGWVKIAKGWVSKTYLREIVPALNATYTVNTALRVRATPNSGSTIIGWKTQGTILEVVKIDELGWAELSDGGYCFAYFLTKVK